METKCYNHPAVSATATCADCGAPICTTCTRMLRGRPFCPSDYAMAAGEAADVLLPVSIPLYQREPQTRQMSPTPAIKAIEQPSAVQIEQYRLTPNFVYQHAANTSVEVQDTASMLLQTEEPPLPKTEGKPRKAWEDTMIWAGIGLVCALTAVFAFNTGMDVYNDSSSFTGTLGLNALLSVISLIATFWTVLSRQDSSRPRYIIWIGLTSIIVLAILWISTPFLIHEKEQYLLYLENLRNSHP